MSEKIEARKIEENVSIIHSLKKMDSLGVKSLIVVDEKNIFKGILSIGDIQRAIIKGLSLDISVSEILRSNTKYARENDSFDDIKSMMIHYRMELCPVIENNQWIKEVYFWEDIFPMQTPQIRANFKVPVVLMAGGFGTRMRPLTYILPKPLIPVGEKTILQEIFDSFYKYGCTEFYTSVNYKADFIKDFVDKLNLPYQVNYFEEDKPLGTAGSLQLLKKKINTTFFVHNCDIIIDNDYSEILDYHNHNKNEITIVAALKHFPIAYGTIETGENGELISLSEKPEMTFKINSGLYILEPHLLNDIPDNQFFHITDLIKLIKERQGKIGVFPVSEKSWTDIGNWEEYLKVVKNTNQ
ncbi:MAG: nucleotidyltransferase family protein [Brumimicrobium sp.]|nr:nucleotidyltransferase family protein [Brumimicrobium sp.]